MLGNKITIVFYASFTGFLIVSLLSSLWAINSSETIVYSIKTLTSLISCINLFFLIKDDHIEIFKIISKFLLVLLFLESLYVINFFINNTNTARSADLLNLLITKHYQNYSNINILSAALTIKVPFAFVYLLNSSKYLKWLSVLTISSTMSATLLIGARTGSYSFFILLFTFLIYTIFNKLYQKEHLTYVSLVFLLGFSFFFTLNLNRIDGGRANSIKQMYSPSKRVIAKLKSSESITSNENQNIKKTDLKAFTSLSSRDIIWEHAASVFLKKPLLGWGNANWKLTPHDELKVKLKTNIYLNTQRVHNDYLQTLAELGIIGFIFFLGAYFIIPCLIFIHFIKTKSIHNSEERNTYFVLGLTFLYFQIDMFMNFPLYWTPILIIFIINTIFLLSFHLKKTKLDSTKAKKHYSLIILLLILISTYTTYKNYNRVKSSIEEWKIYSEISNKTYEQWPDLKSSYEDIINRLSGIDQDLDDLGSPIEGLKAIYAISDKRYPKAKKHLRKSIHQAPNNHVAKSLLARIYLETENKPDSAYIFAKEVFHKIPTDLNTYLYLRRIYKEKRDTINLLKLLNKRLAFVSDDAIAWKNKAFYSYHNLKKDTIIFSKILDSAARILPAKSKELMKYKSTFLHALSMKRSKKER